ncbi:LPS translocon maturation chaperone LptM [Methylohalobius crimeensis]|uniref:LPS translocon maturation chaperone LptM n=1 Tax=Methylohalobius crimeensis TaxID=244365 RepID=UPI000406D458
MSKIIQVKFFIISMRSGDRELDLRDAVNPSLGAFPPPNPPPIGGRAREGGARTPSGQAPGPRTPRDGFCEPSFTHLALLLLLISAVQLTGCGQKGDLYLPEPEQTQEKEKR